MYNKAFVLRHFFLFQKYQKTFWILRKSYRLSIYCFQCRFANKCWCVNWGTTDFFMGANNVRLIWCDQCRWQKTVHNKMLLHIVQLISNSLSLSPLPTNWHLNPQKDTIFLLLFYNCQKLLNNNTERRFFFFYLKTFFFVLFFCRKPSTPSRIEIFRARNEDDFLLLEFRWKSKVWHLFFSWKTTAK